MTIPSTAKRILSVTPLALVAAWLLTPASLTTELDEELAQRGVTVTSAPEVLGATVEGIAVRLHSDSATTASVEIVSTDGTSTGLVDLPYVTYLDDHITSFSITATVETSAQVACTIEQNTTVLDTNSEAGAVACQFGDDTTTDND